MRLHMCPKPTCGGVSQCSSRAENDTVDGIKIRQSDFVLDPET